MYDIIFAFTAICVVLARFWATLQLPCLGCQQVDVVWYILNSQCSESSES